MKRLVSAGEILVEIMAERVGQSLLEPGPLVGPFPSGAPAIFVGQAARLGQPAGLIGAVGDDDFGRLNIARLRALGADVSAIAVHPGRTTGSAFVSYNADASRDFVYNIVHSAAADLDAGRRGCRSAAVIRYGVIHVSGSALSSEAMGGKILGLRRPCSARACAFPSIPTSARNCWGAQLFRDGQRARRHVELLPAERGRRGGTVSGRSALEVFAASLFGKGY